MNGARKVQLGCGGLYVGFVLLSVILSAVWSSSRSASMEELQRTFELRLDDHQAADATRAKLAAEAGLERAAAELRLYRAERPDDPLPTEFHGLVSQTYVEGADIYAASVTAQEGDAFTIEVVGRVLIRDRASSEDEPLPKAFGHCEGRLEARITADGIRETSRTLQDLSPPAVKVSYFPLW